MTFGISDGSNDDQMAYEYEQRQEREATDCEPDEQYPDHHYFEPDNEDIADSLPFPNIHTEGRGWPCQRIEIR